MALRSYHIITSYVLLIHLHETLTTGYWLMQGSWQAIGQHSHTQACVCQTFSASKRKTLPSVGLIDLSSSVCWMSHTLCRWSEQRGFKRHVQMDWYLKIYIWRGFLLHMQPSPVGCSYYCTQPAGGVTSCSTHRSPARVSRDSNLQPSDHKPNLSTFTSF